MTEVVFRGSILLYQVLPPLSLLLLIGLWLFAVIRLHGAVRLALMLTGIGVFVLAAVLFGGHWLLQQYELTWRFWVKMLLAMLLWCAGLAVSVLTAWLIPRAVEKEGWRAVSRAAAVLCLVVAMGIGTIWGGFWIGPATEEVTVYHGTEVVEETTCWLDYCCVIYEYRGPFVRGSRPIGPIGG